MLVDRFAAENSIISQISLMETSSDESVLNPSKGLVLTKDHLHPWWMSLHIHHEHQVGIERALSNTNYSYIFPYKASVNLGKILNTCQFHIGQDPIDFCVEIAFWHSKLFGMIPKTANAKLQQLKSKFHTWTDPPKLQ